MFRSLALATFLVLLDTATAPAADIYADVDGVAHFIRAAGGYDELLTHGSALPNGGRTFDFGEFSHGFAPCEPFTGQSDYLCASASASVEIDRRPVQTSTYIGVATDVRLKAMARLEYRNAPGYSVGQIWGRARVYFPIICHGSVTPPVNGLKLHYRLDGEYAVSSSDPDVTLDAPRPFETCDPGGACVIEVGNFTCPPEGTTTTVGIDLFPRVIFHNLEFHTGWTVLAVSDYSHTLTVEGMDVLDANGNPMAGVRAVVPDASGGVNDTFLTSAEAAEIAESTTTTTTIAGTSTTTTSGGGTTTTTSSTLPPCAGMNGAVAADCRCRQRPLPACDGVTVKGPIAKGVTGLCAAVAKAAGTTGRKQGRLVRRGAKLSKGTLTRLNGRKGVALGDACRAGLQALVGAVQNDLAPAP
jgi:hypothetical protein